MSAGLYLHIPFCVSKCSYCDFYSAPFSDNLKECYTAALTEKINSVGRLFAPFDTLYMGGGTPTVLPPDKLCQIIEASNTLGTFKEATVEANPADHLYNTFVDLRKTGINRLSLGVQSGNNDELKLLGRRHSVEDAKQTVADARKAGFKNISLDIMLGIPNQTMKSLEKTVDFLLSLSPKHISSYMLKIEDGTPFSKMKLNLPDEDTVCNMYLYVCKRLKEAGFEHYEISNWARKGYECQHNLKYWRDEEYLGLGPAAHSFMNGKRFYYDRDINGFIDGNKPINDQCGGSDEERIMLGLRLREGVPVSGLDKNYLKTLENCGLVNLSDKQVNLTEKGFLVSNTIIAEILSRM